MEIESAARRCFVENHDEAAWNADVHNRLLDKVSAITVLMDKTLLTSLSGMSGGLHILNYANGIPLTAQAPQIFGIICLKDFLTSGSTFATISILLLSRSMRRKLMRCDKNCLRRALITHPILPCFVVQLLAA
jgi:hypothetical protein